MSKENKKQAFINKQKKEYTVKVVTIVKVIVIIGLMGASFVGGWNVRSEFSNEVRSEVKHQMASLKANQ